MSAPHPDAPIVIVGSGLAGITVARELRKLNADIPLIIISADDGAFYSKPSLSNALAAGKLPEQLVVTPSAKLAEQLKARFITGERVTAIDTATQTISTTTATLSYRQLVLAVGAQAIRLPLSGSGAEAVLSVNNLADYAVFRSQLAPGARVAILGGGLIGCEFANDLRSAGHAVSVFDVANQALGRLLPPKAGAYFREKLETAGVVFHFGISISTIEADAGAYVLSTATGASFSADIVLSAIGLKPATSLAEQAQLKTNRGIVVNRRLETSMPNIYALGDCAEVEGLVLPYVLPIMSAARALAKTLAGEPSALSYPAMPIMVKTPACPTIVSPPALDVVGAWGETVSAEGVRSVFTGAEGAVLGFALVGNATQERQALASQLPPVLA